MVLTLFRPFVILLHPLLLLLILFLFLLRIFVQVPFSSEVCVLCGGRGCLSAHGGSEKECVVRGYDGGISGEVVCCVFLPQTSTIRDAALSFMKTLRLQ